MGVTAAGIYDLHGNPWAYSAGFAAQIAEVAAISTAMQTDANSLAALGVVVAGVKYMYVRGDSTELVAKEGSTGVVVQKCKTCLIVAYHSDTIQSGACNNAVAKLADFLRENSI